MFGKNYVTLDIGSKTTKIVHGTVNKGLMQIIEYEIIDTPVGAIKDGKISDIQSLVKAVGAILEKQKIKTRNLIMNISGTGVITRDIQIPKSTDDELEKMLEFEAQQYFPVDLENYVLDFKVLEEVTVNEIAQSRLLLVAVPVKQVEEYIKIPQNLKMKLKAIDLPANCVLKFLFGNSTINSKQTDIKELPREFALIDIGNDTTSVCIFNDNKLKFNRILLNGGRYMDILISNESGVDIDKAEKLKYKLDLNPNGNDETEKEYNGNIRQSLAAAANNLVNDINRFIEFYNSRSSVNKLEVIYICGGVSNIKGLAEYISGIINIPVMELPVFKDVVYKGSKTQEQFVKDYKSLVNAVGALWH